MITQQAHAFVDQIAKAIELVGVGIIVLGLILSTIAYLRGGLRSHNWRSAYERYRSNLGRGILLGLELLVAADIISTITAPLTFISVGLLAAIVAAPSRRCLCGCGQTTGLSVNQPRTPAPRPAAQLRQGHPRTGQAQRVARAAH